MITVVHCAGFDGEPPCIEVRIGKRVHGLTVDNDESAGNLHWAADAERLRAEAVQAVDQVDHACARFEELHVVVLAQRLARVEPV